MSKFVNWCKSPSGLLVLLSVLTTVILPWPFRWLHISVPERVFVLFILIDMSLALWIGRTIKKHHLKLWWVLLMPVLFAGMVFWRFAQYDYWFAGIYLVLSLLAWLKD
ncbi:hypothetical protein [Lacticaseibacillus yichunensis]|uniref:Uncharacterized protein n=1 Tax=Lacticaseibacillus yichunensis TaxID=2486015 RepID=A0ABW4CNR4_9LACO|nr:hypothetical protein [Lacticaseibacillus yichunensis]